MAKHIIIVGAGLGGPCLALCLARRGISSTIYEIRPSPSLSGGSISLSANALKILDKYCGVYPQLRDTGYSYRQIGVYTDGGEKLGVVQAGDREDKEGGYAALRIMRSELQRVLVAACEESGRVKVKYGMKVRQGGIEEEAFGVRVQFEDGSEDQGDLLVGADGIHSQIRDYVLGPNSIKPTYDGICVVNGFVPAHKLSIPEDFTLPAFLFAQSGIFMGIPINAQASTIAWGINITLPERSREEWAAFEASGEAARVAKRDYEGVTMQPIRDLLNLARDEEAKIWSTYSIGEIPTWTTGTGDGKGRVVLMGDAAHGMPPNGLGSTMAFEDAATLCRLISENITTTPKGDDTYGSKALGKTKVHMRLGDEEIYKAIVKRYEEIRRPRVKKIETGGKGARNARTKSGGDWVWWAKKWAFRAFFWWKGGVVVHVADGGFDIDTIDVKV